MRRRPWYISVADASDAHFAPDSAYWSRRRTDVAFPPYWFFLSDGGRAGARTTDRTDALDRVHVPADVPSRPAERASELRGHELFTEPGEWRTIR